MNAAQQKTFAERLAWALGHRGMSQAALARAVKMKRSGVQDLLSGKAKRTTRLAEMALALDVSATWLGVGIGSPIPWKDVSQEGRIVASRFDALPPHMRQEVIGYLDYIISRESDASLRGLEPVARLISRLTA